MENTDNNKILHDNQEVDDYEFSYNFITTPWDDRSKQSKWGIIALLVTVFIALMACVVGNFIIHYRGYQGVSQYTNKLNCHLVKASDYSYAARIHSVSTQELLCIGAVVSLNSVLANKACLQSGPIKIQVGSFTDPHCKKSYAVHSVSHIFHEGVVSKKIVLLTTYVAMVGCAKVIQIGQNIDWNTRTYIVGRPLHGERSLSRTPVSLSGNFTTLGISTKSSNRENIICVRNIGTCPVQAGDLLIQRNQLFGLASSSFRPGDKNTLACFADLTVIKELKEGDSEIK